MLSMLADRAPDTAATDAAVAANRALADFVGKRQGSDALGFVQNEVGYAARSQASVRKCRALRGSGADPARRRRGAAELNAPAVAYTEDSLCEC